MESDNSPPSTSPIKCCECGCSCSMINRSVSGTSLRTVNRKYDELDKENRFTIPGFVISQNARVVIENECFALRETVSSQQQIIQDLICELDEERYASSSSANEAMSMILRLQREKAEVQMESRQFKRLTEEKTAHDQQEMLALEDLLYNREQTIQSLTCEIQAYKYRMMSYGLTENEANGAEEVKNVSRNASMTENLELQFEIPPCEIYPPLRCTINESQVFPNVDEETADVEKYAFGETPRDRLKDLGHRLNELEKSPRTIQPVRDYFSTKNMLEKVIVGQSPRRSRHLRKISTDCSYSQFTMDKEQGQDSATYSPNFASSLMNSNLRKMDNASEVGDEMNVRIYTIDSIHQRSSFNGVMDPNASIGTGCDDYLTSPRDSLVHFEVRDPEVQKLCARLQALEADRETMRQTILSVGTDKAHLVLLKEIAQNLCKDVSPSKAMPVQKQSVVRSFFSISLFKLIASFVFWRRKAQRCKYMFGLSTKNQGLLLLLHRGPRVGQRRQVSTINM